MSNMSTWAEREVKFACKKEGECDYGIACYESALKAFKSLMEDGHSGCSIGFTKQILNRLIDGLPLTPIEDTEEVWNKITYSSNTNGTRETYQCRRMSSLFKDVYADGTIKYHDNDRYICVDINNPDCTYSCGLARRIIDEMFPISMPYYPQANKIKVYCEDFLTDKKNGDFDTVGIFYAIMPDGERVEINRFFKETPNNWEEISLIEYTNRKNMKI